VRASAGTANSAATRLTAARTAMSRFMGEALLL
jgi:hypothetical protein